MKIIIPLAGPDFILPDGSTKAEIKYAGKDLLHFILQKRSWYESVPSDQYIFILQDKKETRRLVLEKLQVWFPNCKSVFLSQTTEGAAFTITAALPYINDLDESLLIDLADIDYSIDAPVMPVFEALSKDDALAFTFDSDNPLYSYLEYDQNGQFLRAREKEVISSIASAGTYFFGSLRTLLNAYQYVLKNKSTNIYNGLMYVCPLFNGVKAISGQVQSVNVSNVVDLKLGG